VGSCEAGGKRGATVRGREAKERRRREKKILRRVLRERKGHREEKWRIRGFAREKIQKTKENALVVLADEDGGAEDGSPEAAFVADRGLRDVHSANDFVGDTVDLFFLVET